MQPAWPARSKTVLQALGSLLFQRLLRKGFNPSNQVHKRRYRDQLKLYPPKLKQNHKSASFCIRAITQQQQMELQYKGRYKRVQRIGSGAFGVIYKVKSIPEGKTLIAKHIPLFNLQRSEALQEFKILQKLKHHYIVRYEDSFSEQDQLVIIMQYCGEKDLSWHIQQRKKSGKHFSQYLVTNWILQLLLAVGFMHTNKIVHRDLKPQNVFVDSDMNLKIGDFGISRILDHTAQHCQTSAGTPSYMAPEIVDSEDYNFKADIWSLGCIIWEICSLQRLFPLKDQNDKPIGLIKMMDLIKHKQIKDIPSLYSQDLRKLVKKLLIRIPQKRPKAEDLLKDKLLVQLMINRINQKDNLKQEYTKGKDVPSLTNSLLDRQANAVKQQLRKLELQVQQKMHGLKQKKVEKNQLESFEKQLKKKMSEVQNAVKLAFKQLYKNGNFEQSSKQSEIKQAKNNSGKSLIYNKSTISNDSLQNSSDITIQSVQLQSNRQIQKNESDISLVQSGMIETKNIKMNSQQSQKSKAESKSKLGSSIKKSTFSKEQSKNMEDFQGTLQSQFTNTIQTDYFKSVKDPDVLTTTINKLDLLKNTLKNNPEAVLSNSFLNCTLSMSTDPMIQSLKKQKAQDLSATDSLQFELTKGSSPPNKASKAHDIQKKEKSHEEHNEYNQDFEDYNQNEELNERRQAELNSMLALYQQELSRQESYNAMSEGFKYRNKYLVMSQIKEQSYEGGSMISKNESLD